MCPTYAPMHQRCSEIHHSPADASYVENEHRKAQIRHTRNDLLNQIIRTERADISSPHRQRARHACHLYMGWSCLPLAPSICESESQELKNPCCAVRKSHVFERLFLTITRGRAKHTNIQNRKQIWRKQTNFLHSNTAHKESQYDLDHVCVVVCCTMYV